MIPSSESALIISSQKGKIIVKHKFDCTVSLLKVAQFVSKVRMQTGLALSFFLLPALSGFPNSHVYCTPSFFDLRSHRRAALVSDDLNALANKYSRGFLPSSTT